MGKSNKAPEYATSSYDTGGLFGSSTTNAGGTTFTPTAWQRNTMNVIGNNLPTTLSNMLSGDYLNDPNFQVYQNDFNRRAAQSYDSNVLGQLANKGLMRSSGLQASTNSFNNTLNNGLANLMDNYYNRQASNLANMQNVANNIYSYITGVNAGSQNNVNNVNSYNLNKLSADNTSTMLNNALYGNMATTAANLVFS